MQKIVKSECKFLKTKKSHVPDIENYDGWRTNKSMTGSYWCIKSMKSTGPDGGVVIPESCQKFRTCYISLEF